jgi:opacity protein-like surface antigen
MRFGRFGLTTVVILAALGAPAYAQQAPSGSGTLPPSRGYAEGVAQSAFGNVTSQSFGGEFGIAVRPGVSIFVEGGFIRDAAPASLGTAAQTLASAVTVLAGPTTYRVKEPITFGVAGVKYAFPVSSSSVAPYVLGGAGFAQAKKDVSFTTPSGDITQYATLGTDLSGSETKAMISVGAGVDWLIGRVVVIDLQYRYGRVFTSGDGLNLNRAGVGVGVRF